MRFTSITVSFSILILVGLLFSVFSPLNMTLSTPTVMELDIEGSVAISYSESEIKQSLPPVSGWGGKLKTTGSITTPTYWKGIHLPLMLDSLVGELDYNISIQPSDGYPPQNLTRQEVNGAIRTFNEENVTLDIKAIPVLAFEENNITLDTEDGPLRLVFIGENNQIILTISTLWVKHVDTIQILTEDGSTTTLTTTTQSAESSSKTTTHSTVDTFSSNSTSKSSSSSSIWALIPTLILLILYHRKKRNH